MPDIDSAKPEELLKEIVDDALTPYGEAIYERILSLMQAGLRAQKMEELLREAQEELRLIRMKDTASVYDPTLRSRISIALEGIKNEIPTT